nr:MAG TPA: hypothetical protein [Caudoviricetes sp.]
MNKLRNLKATLTPPKNTTINPLHKTLYINTLNKLFFLVYSIKTKCFRRILL